MKKTLILITVFCIGLVAFAFDYVPKNSGANPFDTNKKAQTEQKTKNLQQSGQPEMREIKTLNEYFRYLPAEVHRHWLPYKAEKDYEITVQFVVHRNGAISDVRIIGTNYPNANPAALKAVKMGAPYQPLPLSYSKDSVKAQVVLEYRAKQ